MQNMFEAGSLPLDRKPDSSEFVSVPQLGAYWFRLCEYARGGMSRMVRWPRKKSDQKLKANQELALAA